MKLYVASSWRNEARYREVLLALREAGHECYDFRNPHPGNNGFQWSEIDTDWMNWGPDQLVGALNGSIAQRGFRNDFEAMHWADACVLVLPCGRSAHLEAGWFAGARKPVWVITNGPTEPELMYLICTGIVTTVATLLRSMDFHRVACLKSKTNF